MTYPHPIGSKSKVTFSAAIRTSRFFLNKDRSYTARPRRGWPFVELETVFHFLSATIEELTDYQTEVPNGPKVLELLDQ
jgi:hypothetical protein